MQTTMNYASIRLTVAFAVGRALTGSIVIGGAMAWVQPAFSTLAVHFQEKAWKRLEVRADERRGLLAA